MLSTCVAQELSYNRYENPTETYIGPSSYTTSFDNDYSDYGNYDGMLNVRNPQISSSYSSFRPSNHNEFGSTSYINYPPTVEHGDYPSTDELESSQPQEISSNSPPQQQPEQSYEQPFYETTNQTMTSYGEETPISQHIEITNPVLIPIYKKLPYAVSKPFPVAIPHPVLVPIPAYYPVNVQISQPIATPVLRELRVPVEKEVLYPVHKYIPMIVHKHVKYRVEKHLPVYVSKPYPVKVRLRFSSVDCDHFVPSRFQLSKL